MHVNQTARTGCRTRLPVTNSSRGIGQRSNQEVQHAATTTGQDPTDYTHHASRTAAGSHRHPHANTNPHPFRRFHRESQSRIPCVYYASLLHQVRRVRVVAAEGGVQ